jgi:uncharacterized membrane protein YedE/YeeE
MMLSERCPWYIAGPLLGLIIILLRAALNKPLGVLGGYIDLIENAKSPRRLGFRAFVFIGIILGAFVYGVLAGTFSISWDGASGGGLLRGPTLLKGGILLLAGLAMGFGARTAGGCTSGHGLSGMSLLSRHSLVATATFFATAVILAHILDRISGALP